VSETGFLVGGKFSSADILNSFVIENVYKSSGLDAYPKLKLYIEKLMAMPGSIKAQKLEEQYT
jgi:glutathione S-transferase